MLSPPIVDTSDRACVAQVDRASPLLFQALMRKQAIQASFKFYRQGTSGAEHVYTVEISGAMISSIKTLAGHRLGESNPFPATLEEVQFTVHSITLRDVPTSVEAAYSWTGT
jgi:type VI secretion system Hcp family effector